jgi:hypothetical protein
MRLLVDLRAVSASGVAGCLWCGPGMNLRASRPRSYGGVRRPVASAPVGGKALGIREPMPDGQAGESIRGRGGLPVYPGKSDLIRPKKRSHARRSRNPGGRRGSMGRVRAGRMDSGRSPRCELGQLALPGWAGMRKSNAGQHLKVPAVQADTVAARPCPPWAALRTKKDL